MLSKQEIQLTQLTTQLIDDRMTVNVMVKNPLDRTLYAYASPRRILYDKTTGKLTLALHDQHLENDAGFIRDISRPRVVMLEGNTETEIKLDLPKVINRLRPAAERGNGPLAEVLPIAEANEIQMEIAHQDSPYYYDPKKPAVMQLKEWGSPVATANFQVEPLVEKGTTEPSSNEPPEKR
jgi:hypothetical protein